MKFLRRFIVVLVVTALAHGSLTLAAQAARPSGAKPSSSADLSLNITESRDPWILYAEFDYELIVTNKGPSSGGGTLDIRLSGGHVEYARGTACTLISSRELRCDLGSIASGGLGGASLRVDADSPPDYVSTSMTISGTVNGNQPDPDLSNNQKSESTTVVPYPVVPIPPLPILPLPPLPIDPFCPLGVPCGGLYGE